VNEEYKDILLIMDNFRSHVSKEVRNRAEELGISIVYLPPYSPDLDPLEFIWKSIERIISISFIKTLENLRAIIQRKYKEFSQRLSYATSWINRFLKKNGLCSELCR